MKFLTITGSLSAVCLIIGVVLGRVGSMWAEVVGLGGILLAMPCAFVLVAAWAFSEMKRGDHSEEW